MSEVTVKMVQRAGEAYTRHMTDRVMDAGDPMDDSRYYRLQVEHAAGALRAALEAALSDVGDAP